MKLLNFCVSIFLALPSLLLSSSVMPIETDKVIFLFDNGDKNMIASMLNYAEKQGSVEDIDFRIVFMGASVDAMDKEPFSHFPDKLIHYKQLGISETIDNTWKRDRKLDSSSLAKLLENLQIRQKIWVAVSCTAFSQVLQEYQGRCETVAFRDNPSPYGDTDYFPVAKAVQDAAQKVLVPSKFVSDKLSSLNKEILVIGHAPIEEWAQDANKINKAAVIDRLGLDPKIPIVVYAGVYGDFYQASFEKFLEIAPSQNVQILIVPHPRYKGIVEKECVSKLSSDRGLQFTIVGEFEKDDVKRLKTIEALAIADVVVTADPTSTVVFQANALNKKVLYVNRIVTEVSEALCNQKLLFRVANQDEFQLEVQESRQNKENTDVFKLLGIPKNSAQLLWEEFLK